MQYHAPHMGAVRARRHYYLPSGYHRSDRVVTLDAHFPTLFRQPGDRPDEAHAERKSGRFTLAEGRGERTKPMASSFSQTLNLLGWGGKYSPDATRTTGSTWLNETGYASVWIERQLAHVETNAVRRTYNQAEHLPDRARMMQQWADMLDKSQQGDDKVQPHRQKSAA